MRHWVDLPGQSTALGMITLVSIQCISIRSFVAYHFAQFIGERGDNQSANVGLFKGRNATETTADPNVHLELM
jgi:hypothetical protein